MKLAARLQDPDLQLSARDYANALAWANDIANEFGATVVEDDGPLI